MPIDRPLPRSLSEIIEAAKAVREGAAETRFDLWCERLGGKIPLMEGAIDAGISLMRADQGNLQLIEDNGLVIKAQRGFSKKFLDYFQVVSDGRTACRAAWQQRCLVHVPDVTTSPIYSQPVLEAMLNDGIRAVDSVPLLTDTGRILGVLSVHYRRPHAGRDTDLARFEKLGRFVANLLQDKA
jgi:hypothetical protein